MTEAVRACLEIRPVRAPGLQDASILANCCRLRALTRRLCGISKHALSLEPSGPECCVLRVGSHSYARVLAQLGAGGQMLHWLCWLHWFFFALGCSFGAEPDFKTD